MHTESPLGPLMLAATPHALIRVAFEGHGDFAALEAHASSRRGSRAARQRLGQAAASLHAYVAGAPQNQEWVIDWRPCERGRRDASLAGVDPLRRPSRVLRSGQHPNTRDLGRLMGANPIPIVAACHGATRGVETPTTFVGGYERRQWLETHERGTRHSAAP